MPPAPRNVMDRLWAKVDFTDDHWLWTGTQNFGGYGYIHSGPAPKYADMSVHVLSWVYFNGEYPADGMDVDHLCRVRHCLRPDHLELVPHKINLNRGMGYSQVVARTGVCGKGHEVTGDNIAGSGGKNKCRACRNEWRTQRRQELRAQGFSASEIARRC